MSVRTALLAAACTACAATAHAGDDPRWGVTLWGVSYHVDKTIDYDEENWGAGLRRYLWHRVFVEGDALRNSNRGLVLPASIGLELGAGTLFGACKVSAIAAVTAAYYHNARTDGDEFKIGPVPGVGVRCGRMQPSMIAVFGKSRGLVALVGAVTIHF